MDNWQLTIFAGRTFYFCNRCLYNRTRHPHLVYPGWKRVPTSETVGNGGKNWQLTMDNWQFLWDRRGPIYSPNVDNRPSLEFPGWKRPPTSDTVGNGLCAVPHVKARNRCRQKPETSPHSFIPTAQAEWKNPPRGKKHPKHAKTGSTSCRISSAGRASLLHFCEKWGLNFWGSKVGG